MKNYIITMAFIGLFIASRAQLPINLIPNHSFENGVHPTSRPCFPFMHGLEDWKAVCFPNNNDECTNTPEWRDLNREIYENSLCTICYGDFVSGNNPFLDTKCILLGQDPSIPNGEHIYVELINTLAYGKKYKIRLLGMSGLGLPYSVLSVHLTVTGNKWHENQNTTLNMLNAMYATHNSQNNCSADVFEHIISVDKNNLRQIVLQASYNFFYVDRVELYEYCTSLLTRQGRIYKFDRELEEAGTIIAGSVINNAPAMGDVEMLDGSVTMYKASTVVKLTEGFYVNRGADFTAKIAPCGKDCPTTDINIPNEYALCNSDCINLTTGTVSRGLTVNWTAQDQQNLTYLYISKCT